MSRWYKAPNKRLIARGSNGRFRQTTLSDIGGGCCDLCGKLYVPNYEEAKVGPYIDPLKLNMIRSTCPECRGSGSKDSAP
jgi:hypothetical protein